MIAPTDIRSMPQPASQHFLPSCNRLELSPSLSLSQKKKELFTNFQAARCDPRGFGQPRPGGGVGSQVPTTARPGPRKRFLLGSCCCRKPLGYFLLPVRSSGRRGGRRGRRGRQAGKRPRTAGAIRGKAPAGTAAAAAAVCLSAAFPVGANPQGERRRPDCAKREDGQAGSGGEEPSPGQSEAVWRGLPALPLCHPPPSRFSAPAWQSALLRNSLEFRES